METLNKHKLVISDFCDEKMLGFALDDKGVFRIYNLDEDYVLGNIYCGYVKDVVKNINAAFVEFDDKIGYLSLKDIEQTLHSGDKVLIQVSGDRIKSKDYRLTTKINLTSKAVVLTVGNTDISISKKITGKKEREELKELLNEYKNKEFGFIIRTNATECGKEELLRQTRCLIEKWQKIKHQFNFASPKTALFRNDCLVKVCKEFVDKYHGTVVTDNEKIFEKVKNAHIDVLFNGDGKVSLCNKYSLDKYLKEALSKKVWLKSGAYLIIEYTEALTVVDINTGKADLRTCRNETFKKINKEAALEISRQLQLRNLSGIIVIDFINMDDKTAYNELFQTMEEAVKGDYNPCYIVGFTKLGLMEMSRKKTEKPIYELINNYLEVDK